MGNQHATKDFWWLIGIIDGEGSLMLSKSIKGKKIPEYRPRITITNSNPIIISKVKNILTDLNIAFCEYKQDKRQHQTRCTYQVHISKICEVNKFSKMLLNRLVGKNRQCIILLYLTNNWKNCSLEKKEQGHQLTTKLNCRIPKSC